MDLTTLLGIVPSEYLLPLLGIYLVWEVIRRLLPLKTDPPNKDDDDKPETPEVINTENRAIG